MSHPLFLLLSLLAINFISAIFHFPVFLYSCLIDHFTTRRHPLLITTLYFTTVFLFFLLSLSLSDSSLPLTPTHILVVTFRLHLSRFPVFYLVNFSPLLTLHSHHHLYNLFPLTLSLTFHYFVLSPFSVSLSFSHTRFLNISIYFIFPFHFYFFTTICLSFFSSVFLSHFPFPLPPSLISLLFMLYIFYSSLINMANSQTNSLIHTTTYIRTYRHEHTHIRISCIRI